CIAAHFHVCGEPEASVPDGWNFVVSSALQLSFHDGRCGCSAGDTGLLRFCSTPTLTRTIRPARVQVRGAGVCPTTAGIGCLLRRTRSYRRTYSLAEAVQEKSLA